MATRMTRIVLGLSVAASSLVMGKTAGATVWKNYANESFCLSSTNGGITPGTQLRIRTCNGAADQTWGR